MKHAFRLFPAILTIHDGAAAGAAASATGEGGGAAAELPTLPSQKRGKTGDTPAILYGKQPQQEGAPAAGEKTTPPNTTTATSDALEAKKAEFEKLINGEYKDIFTDRTQQMIDRRFKETKGLQEQLDGLSPLLDTMRQKYKTPEGDNKKLVEAFEADSKFVEELAEEQGLSVDQWKQQQKILRENAQLRKVDQERRAQGQYATWMQEAADLQKQFPSFNLQAEAANPQFTAMLRSGIPLATAYKAMHLSEITNEAAQVAAKQAETNVVANIRAKGQRPAEAGAVAQSGVIVKNDVTKLTAADRKAIAERVRRGEKITF